MKNEEGIKQPIKELAALHPRISGLTTSLQHQQVEIPLPNSEQTQTIAIAAVAEEAQEALRESEARLRLALEATQTGIWDWNILTNSITWSDNFESLFGLTPGTFSNFDKVFLQYIHPEDRKLVIQSVTQAVEQRADCDVEFRIVWPDGSIRWIAGKGQVFCADGQAFRMVGTAMDITKRKQAEERWRQQTEQERLVTQMAQRIRRSLDLEEILRSTVAEVRQFLQIQRVFIYRFEPDWSGIVAVESVDPDWSAIIGAKIKDSFFGETSGRELYKQGRIQAIADVYQAGLSKCHIDFLAKLQIRASLVVPILQGEQLWGLMVANHCSEPRHWQQLEINLLSSLAMQVALAIQQAELYRQVQTELVERQRAEQKIREQAALLDIATDAILVRNLENRILFWNKGAENMYGWQAAEAVGKNANELLYKETPPQLQEAQKAVALQGEWYGELRKVTRAGKEIIVESRWTLVRNQQGKAKSILTVDTNITAKKQLEAQFLRAQRLESLGTLASGIAHDLNNILAPILMSTQLLQMKIPDQRSQMLLKTLETNTKRGAALVKQVLSFARGVEGKHTTLQVRHLISEIKQIAIETFPKSIEIYTNVTPDLWTVCGDATQLHQVLMNLCVNARDAMPDGGYLSICADNLLIDQSYASIHLDAKVGPYIVICVADTGTGIPPEILDKIFEPFFTTKELGKGTGLGLSTVIGIIKSHGGFVNVYSELGEGTQFEVHLPAVETVETLEAEKNELPPGHGELILVVDDEAVIREITKTSLETHNYRVLTASNGIEALALYAEHRDKISLVLTDMMMPEMDGSITIRTLQKVNPEVNIIAVSGLASRENVGLVKAMGVKAFLSKPYTAQELLETLREVIGP